jgi:hypothetical protein
MNSSKKRNSKKNDDAKESDPKLNDTKKSDSKLDHNKEPDSKLDPSISEECKKELQEIRAEIKKGKYIELKNVEDLARRCGLKK